MKSCDIHTSCGEATHKVRFQSSDWTPLCRTCARDVMRYARKSMRGASQISWYRYFQQCDLISIEIERIALFEKTDPLYPLALGLTLFFNMIEDDIFTEFFDLADVIAERSQDFISREHVSNAILQRVFQGKTALDVFYEVASLETNGRASTQKRRTLRALTGYAERKRVK